MKKEYCTPEIIIRKYDLCEEVSESGGENPDQKKEPENPSEEQAPDNPDSPKEPEKPSGEKIPDTPDQEKETGDIDNESKIGNKYYTILQCAVMLDKYYESARKLDNGNNNTMTFQSEDLKKWQDFYYPTLVESKIIQNGDYFDATNPDSYGIKKDGTFTKQGFCHFAYRCYKTIMDNTQVAETYAPLYNFCCSLDEDVEYFRGSAYNCSEQRYIKKMDLWRQEYYETYSKTGTIEDADFFNGGNPDPNYGIGADGLYDKQELIHFLYRAYRYIYSFHMIYSDKIYAGIDFSESLNSTFYKTLGEGNIAYIYFYDSMYSEIKYKNEVSGIQKEYIVWKCKEGEFEGIAEKTKKIFKISTSNYKPNKIITKENNHLYEQELKLQGHLLDYWVGTYINNGNSLQIKDIDTIIWKDDYINYIYNEDSDNFEIVDNFNKNVKITGNFKIVDCQKQIYLTINDLVSKNITTEIYKKENTPKAKRNYLRFQHNFDKLSQCVLCNQYYHSVDCYISLDNNIDNMNYLVELPQQSTVEIFLPSNTILHFVTEYNLLSSYQVNENENYLLLGMGEDFDEGCSVRVGEYSYFSLKTRFDYKVNSLLSDNDLNNTRAAQLMNLDENNYRFFRLYTTNDSHLLMIKYEKFITFSEKEAVIYILAPDGKTSQLSQMEDYVPYIEDNGGFCIIEENLPIGEWIIAIPNNENTEIAVTGQVIPTIENDTDGQKAHDMIINALEYLYECPEDKYAELFYPFKQQESTSQSSCLLMCDGARVIHAFQTPFSWKTSLSCLCYPKVIIVGAIVIAGVSFTLFIYNRKTQSLVDEMIDIYKDVENICAKDKVNIDLCIEYQQKAKKFRNDLYDQYPSYIQSKQPLSILKIDKPSLKYSNDYNIINIQTKINEIDNLLEQLYNNCIGIGKTKPDLDSFNNVEEKINKLMDGYDAITKILEKRKQYWFRNDKIKSYYNTTTKINLLDSIFYSYCELCKGGLFKLAAEKIKDITGFTLPKGHILTFKILEKTSSDGESDGKNIYINQNLIFKNDQYTNQYMINGKWGYNSYQDKFPFGTIIHEFQHIVFENCINIKLRESNLLPLINEGLSEFIVGKKRIYSWKELETILTNRQSRAPSYSTFKGVNEDYVVAQFFISYLYHYNGNNNSKNALKQFLKELQNHPTSDPDVYINDRCLNAYGKSLDDMFSNFLKLKEKDFESAFGKINFSNEIIPMYTDISILQNDISKIVPEPIKVGTTDTVILNNSLILNVIWEVDTNTFFIDNNIVYETIDSTNMQVKDNVFMSDLEHHVTQQKKKWESIKKVSKP